MARTSGNNNFLWDYIIKPWGRLFRQPAFLLCVVLLGISAGGLRAGEEWLQWNFRKEAAPLRKGLNELDRSQLGPYKITRERRFPHEIEAELGAQEYIDWDLEDTSAESPGSVRHLHLFVAYYTGNPDKVPHVPDQCMAASGAELRNGQNIEIRVPNCGQEEEDDRLPLRIMDVWMPHGEPGMDRGMVAYFFGVNGVFRCTRNQVRWRQYYWKDRYTYFSKVEIFILNQDELTRGQAIAAVEKLCQTVAPILWSEHWPDWSSLSAKD